MTAIWLGLYYSVSCLAQLSFWYVIHFYLNYSILTLVLQAGKVHFGYIYGVALLGSLSLHLILNLMSHPGHGTNYLRSASVLGYCLLPLVITSFLGILFSMDGTAGYALVAAAILWCTYSASSMFVAVLRVRDVRWLVAYPLGLFYSVFGIMAIFGGKLASTRT